MIMHFNGKYPAFALAARLRAIIWALLFGLALSLMFSRDMAAAQDTVSFKGKQIRLIFPSAPGGSSDVVSQLLMEYLSKHLPGKPVIVPQAMFGGHGVSAHNYFAAEAKPDGLTIDLISNAEADPMTSRTPQAHFDPRKFEIVGGIGFGDNIMIIRTAALPRLLDKTQPPVAMGSVSGAPRSGMRMTTWGENYLGWNVRWVTGYPGSADLRLALENGEIDMTSFPRYFVKDKFLDLNTYKILYVDGLVDGAPASGRPDADNAPRFVDAMKDKISDPKMRAAYDYWQASKLFKAVALPPGTPPEIVAAYRLAFSQIAADPEFRTKAAAQMTGSLMYSADQTTKLIADLVNTPDEALTTTQKLWASP